MVLGPPFVRSAPWVRLDLRPLTRPGCSENLARCRRRRPSAMMPLRDDPSGARAMHGPTRLHHVAFAARDVEATYDFYSRRLGMRLVHAENHLTDKGWFRHFFFDMGGGEALGFFAFENV